MLRKSENYKMWWKTQEVVKHGEKKNRNIEKIEEKYEKHVEKCCLSRRKVKSCWKIWERMRMVKRFEKTKLHT